MQLFRFDPATSRSSLLTDGKSRNGCPVRARDSGLIAFDSTRRRGHDGADRDLWVMNPARPVEREARLGGRGFLERRWIGPRTTASSWPSILATGEQKRPVAGQREDGREDAAQPPRRAGCTGVRRGIRLTAVSYTCSATEAQKRCASGGGRSPPAGGNRSPPKRTISNRSRCLQTVGPSRWSSTARRAAVWSCSTRKPSRFAARRKFRPGR